MTGPTSSAGRFIDRADAGRRLAARLDPWRERDVVVLGLARGGVPVAYEVARALAAPLDTIVVRKLGLPGEPEVAMGAIAEGGFEVLDRLLAARSGIDDDQIRAIEDDERHTLEQRAGRLRHERGRIDLQGRTAIIVDDGLATGATARVACEVARHLGADQVVLGIPVGPPGVEDVVAEADQVVCLNTPEPFLAVGHHYRNFKQTTDEEVVALLDAAREGWGSG